MSTSANLAAGQFITSVGGRRCTAVPRAGANIAAVVTASPSSSSSSSSSSTSTSTSTSSSTSTTALASVTPSSSTAIVAATSSPVTSALPLSSPASSTILPQASSPALSALPPLSSVSNSPLPVPSSAQETNVAQAPQAQGTNDSIPSSAVVVPAIASSPLPAAAISSSSPAAASSPAANAAPAPQAQAQPLAQTTPSSSGIIQASQADTGIIASLSTAAATAAASTTTPAAAVPAVAVSTGAAANAGADTASIATTATGAANGIAASAIAGTDAAATSEATSEPIVLITATFPSTSISNGNGAAVLSTIPPPTAATTADGTPSGAATAGQSASGSGSSASTSGTNPTTTIAVAGGVIGGLAFLALLFFLWWFWQRRIKRKRHSTLLTPLSNVPARFREDGGSGRNEGNAGNEKGGGEYVINRGSIGPTPKVVRIKASLDYGIQQIKGQFSKIMAGKGRGASYNNNEKPASTANNNPGQPDFLTLLGMDERELERAAQNKKNYQKKRASRGGSRSSSSLMAGMNSRGGSNSNNDYLGRLNISFDDPFSDANAVGGPPAKLTPLTVSQADNPFADSHAVPSSSTKPVSNYVADLRRSRGQSASMNSARGASMYRESVATVATAATVDPQAKRTRFRSDPFDLERPELLGRATPATVPSMPRDSRLSGRVDTGEIRRPRGSHQRSESFTSKYSSGVSSMGDWSDPGPDVGPSSGSGNGLQRTSSGNSNQTVGKAL